MKENSKSPDTDQQILRIVKEKRPQSVEQLLSIAKDELKIQEQELLELLLKMQSEGKITLKKQMRPATCFSVYIKSEHTFWYWATITTAVITTIVVFIVPEDLYPWIYIRHVLGAIFVLWLPGYTFIKALFPEWTPKTSEKPLDKIERIALSVGMSLALVPIIGLLLNYTPWGIRVTPVVLSLLALTVAFATAALLREYQNMLKLKTEK